MPLSITLPSLIAITHCVPISYTAPIGTNMAVAKRVRIIFESFLSRDEMGVVGSRSAHHFDVLIDAR